MDSVKYGKGERGHTVRMRDQDKVLVQVEFVVIG